VAYEDDEHFSSNPNALALAIIFGAAEIRQNLICASLRYGQRMWGLQLDPFLVQRPLAAVRGEFGHNGLQDQ
jgi:hypothetical protein